MTIFDLLMYYNRQPKDSMFSHISKVVLKNYRKIPDMGIENLAALCNVATSTISRFCREIGCGGFNDFKRDMSTVRQRNVYFGNYIHQTKRMSNDELYRSYFETLAQILDYVKDGVDKRELIRITEAMNASDKVCFFGLFLPWGITHLQVDLTLDGKETTACTNAAEQVDEVDALDSSSFSLIFHTKVWQSEQMDRVAKRVKEKGGKLAVITNTKMLSYLHYADFAVCLDATLNSIDEVSFEAVAQLIGAIYRNNYIFV
jgi:DNA-binding MurR/RpiR family transcriptional regulator